MGTYPGRSGRGCCRSPARTPPADCRSPACTRPSRDRNPRSRRSFAGTPADGGRARAGACGGPRLRGPRLRGPPYGGEALWLRGHPAEPPAWLCGLMSDPRGGQSPRPREGETGGPERVGDKPKAAQLEVWAPSGPCPSVAVPPVAFMPHQGVWFAPAGPGGRVGLTGASGPFDNGHTTVPSLRAEELLCGIPRQSPLSPRTTGRSPGRRHSRSIPRHPCPCRTARSAAGSRAGRWCASRSESALS